MNILFAFNQNLKMSKKKINKIFSNLNFSYLTFSKNNGNLVFKNIADLLASKKIAKAIIVDQYANDAFIYFSKIKNLVAANSQNIKLAKITVNHNNSDVLCLSYDIMCFCKLKKIINSFVYSEFEGQRHIARLEYLKNINNLKTNVDPQKKDTIVIGSDHAGFILKNKIIAHLQNKGYKTIDVGTYENSSTNYAIWGEKIAKKMPLGYKAIAICGSGIGICNAVNKASNESACPILTKKELFYHKNVIKSNVIGFGANYISETKAIKFLDIFLN